MTSIAPRPVASDDGRRAPTLCIDARVTHYAAPLLEFILSEADIGWREIARGDVDARVVIETTADRLDATVAALRQRLGGNLVDLRLPDSGPGSTVPTH
jgi:hypothetical protein